MKAHILKMIGIALALTLAASLCSATSSGLSGYSLKRTTQTIVFKGTPQFEMVQQWLRQNIGSKGDLSALDSIDIELTNTAVAGSQAEALPSAPVPLPTNGAAGDTLTITSCSGGVQQSWTFVYSATGWVLTDYAAHFNTPACGAGGQGSGK